MRINDKLAREILASHADTLTAGHDVTDQLSARYKDIAPLMQLARDVSNVLVTVPVPEQYRSTLLSTLLQASEPVPAMANSSDDGRSDEHIGWLIGGAVAAATGVAVWGLRKVLAGPAVLAEQPAPVG